jgi:glutaredoxin-related protein
MEWIVYYKAGCVLSDRLIELITTQKDKSISFVEVTSLTPTERAHIRSLSGMDSWPQVWRNGFFIGGYEDTCSYLQKHVV